MIFVSPVLTKIKFLGLVVDLVPTLQNVERILFQCQCEINILTCPCLCKSPGKFPCYGKVVVDISSGVYFLRKSSRL